MADKIRLGLACWLLAWVLPAGATIPQAQPFYTQFSPSIEVTGQFYDVSATASGMVFLAGVDGLLQFDGERWQLHPMPGRQLVRSVEAVGERVYVGGFDRFGYSEQAADGSFVFTDLSERFAATIGNAPFADIWDVVVAPEGVWFKALRHAFLWQEASNSLQLWQHEGRFGAMLHHAGSTLLQFRGEGLRRFSGSTWEVVPGTTELSELLTELLPLPDGSLLTLARAGQWWRWSSEAGVQQQLMPASLPSSTEFTAGEVLTDGTFALATDHGDMVFFDPVTQAVTRASIESGFLGGMDTAAGQGLLVASNAGFYSFDWPSPWSQLPAARGYAGTLNGVESDAGMLYVLGTSGVHRMDISNGQFVQLPWSTAETWDLEFLGSGRALLADAQEIKLVDATGMQVISTNLIYPRVLLRSVFDPALVYVGTEQGMALLQEQSGRWQVVYHNDQLGNPEVNSLVELARGELLVGSGRGGAQHWQLTEADGWQLQVEQLQAASGIGYGAVQRAQLSRLGDGSIIASTASGLYRYQQGSFIEDSLAGLATVHGGGSVLTLATAPDGSNWAYSSNRVYAQVAGAKWQVLPAAGLPLNGLSGLGFSADGDAVLATSNTLVARVPMGMAAPLVSPTVRLVSIIRRTPDEQEQRIPLQAVEPPAITEADWLTFQFALADFRSPSAVQYRVSLEPLVAGEPQWVETPQIAYFALKPGEYRFRLEARAGKDSPSSQLDYVFRVQPRWYQLPLVQLLAFTLALLVLASSGQFWARRRSTRLIAANLALEQIIRERTRALEMANHLLERLALLDGLTAIPNRRRLDQYLEEVWLQCRAQKRSLALALFDVDHFKNYNDTHGHAAGDAVLKAIAGVLGRNLHRTEDLLARYGGEEFMLVLPGADDAAARELVELLRREVEHSGLGLTVSVGVAAAVPGQAEVLNVAVLVARADTALYQAKHRGRNRVEPS